MYPYFISTRSYSISLEACSGAAVTEDGPGPQARQAYPKNRQAGLPVFPGNIRLLATAGKQTSSVFGIYYDHLLRELHCSGAGFKWGECGLHYTCGPCWTLHPSRC